MTPEQARAARAVLGWNGPTAADAAETTPATLSHFESGLKKTYQTTVDRLRAAYEAAGVSFADDGKSISWK